MVSNLSFSSCVLRTCKIKTWRTMWRGFRKIAKVRGLLTPQLTKENTYYVTKIYLTTPTLELFFIPPRSVEHSIWGLVLFHRHAPMVSFYIIYSRLQSRSLESAWLTLPLKATNFTVFLHLVNFDNPLQCVVRRSPPCAQSPLRSS